MLGQHGAQTRDRFAPTPEKTRDASPALELALMGPRGQAAWAVQETADDHVVTKLPKLATCYLQPAATCKT